MMSASAMFRSISVLAPGAKDDFLQTGFIDWQMIRLPGSDALRVDVDDHEAVLRVVLGDHGHGRAANVSCSDAEDVCHRLFSLMCFAR
jgi:hypothetical protein